MPLVFCVCFCGRRDALDAIEAAARTVDLLRCDIAESSRTNLAPVRDKGSYVCEYQRSFFPSARSEPGQAGGGGFSLWLRITFLINSGWLPVRG